MTDRATTGRATTGRLTTDAAAQPFPAVHDYDETLPTDLLVRWTGLDSDRVVLADLGRYLATCAGLTVSLVGITGLACGWIGIAGAIAVMAAGLLVAAASMLVARRLHRRTGLRGKDIDLVLAHRTEIRFESWNQLADRRSAQAWPEEAQLAHRAGRAFTAVKATAIWAEPDQLDHRLRLDPREASRQIHVAAWQIHTLRQQLGSRPAAADAAPVAAEWDVLADQLDRSLAVLRREVEGIEGYRRSVEQANQLMLIDRRRVALRHLNEQAAHHLSAQDARHELATDHLSELNRDLATPDELPGDPNDRQGSV